jgi:hypothetical protein
MVVPVCLQHRNTAAALARRASAKQGDAFVCSSSKARMLVGSWNDSEKILRIHFARIRCYHRRVRPLISWLKGVHPQTEEAKAEAAQVKGTKPSREQATYIGTYSSQLYGDARITEENGKLVLQFVPAPNFIGDLEHWHDDTFRVQWRDSVRYAFPPGSVTFTLKANGQLDEMKIDCPNPDFDFTELDFRRR